MAETEARFGLGQSSSMSYRCRQELLDGIPTLSQIGTPGRIVAFGDDATPVLSGNTERDVVLACAQLGKGRIVVAGQDGYMVDVPGTVEDESIQRLHVNMTKWVTNHSLIDISEILVLKSADDFSRIEECKIVVWHGSNLPDDATEKVMSFVMNGGGLLHGMTPWGWLQLNPGKSLSDMPLYRVLEKAGLCYTGEFLGNDSKGFAIGDALNGNGGFHLGRALDRILELGIWDQDVPNVLCQLSPYAINLLRGKLETVVETYRVELSSCTRSESNPVNETMISFRKVLDENDIRLLEPLCFSKECREEILEGIETLPQVGTPGRVVVFGDDAIPVLSGNTERDVLLACAQLGQGRIVVAGQDGYMIDVAGTVEDESIGRLHLNMKKWVSNQQVIDNSEIRILRSADDVSQIEGCKVVVWHGGSLPDEATDTVMDFVRNGGGLLHGMTPWGWLQLNSGKTLSDMPLYRVLEKAGLCYTGELLGNDSQGFEVAVSLKGTGGFHLGRSLGDILLFDVWHNDVPDVLKQLSPNTINLLESKLLQVAKRYSNELRSCSPPQAVPETDPRKKVVVLFGQILCDKNIGVLKTLCIGKQCRQELLEGITYLPKKGSPGRIVVFGDDATPIVSGNTRGDVLLACAKLGKGRIVVAGQDAYLTDIAGSPEDESIARLHSNMKRWVSNQQMTSSEDILILRSAEDVSRIEGGQIVVWNGGSLPDDATEKVMNFVMNGCGLLHGMTPWGWLQLNPGKTLSDMPLYGVLEEAGLCYTGDFLQNDSEGFEIPDASDGTGGLHLVNGLDAILELDIWEEAVGGALRQLSPYAINTLRNRLEQISVKHSDKLNGCAPSESNPVADPKQKAIIGVCEFLCAQNIGMRKAPSIDTFPGDFKSVPDLQSAEFKFDSKFSDFHPTGFYLPAGIDMTVRILAKEGSGAWKVRVGSHTDGLNKVEKLTRWPNICCEKELPTLGQTTFFSPFGGLVYFVSPDGETKLEVRVDNVVEAPVFDLRDPKSKTDWETRRYAPGLWADISGNLITITIPSESVRNIEKPWEIMEIWDEVVRAHHELRGTLPSQGRREFVVSDQQPSLGYMHSGYPIVTHLDVASPETAKTEIFLLDYPALKEKGAWGMFHEIGHNMQRTWWTFEGTGEVTCNIFTLHAMKSVCGVEPWIHSWLANSLSRIETYLNEGAMFSKWQSDAGVALGIYAQLAHHFGWQAYKAVFRKYESLENDAKPNSEQEKIDSWICYFSEAVKRNLCPLFQFWGLPVSDKVKGELKALPAWLPNDEMTDFAPKRVSLIKEWYPDIKA